MIKGEVGGQVIEGGKGEFTYSLEVSAIFE